MRTTILFTFLLFAINAIYASETLTIQHTTEGSLTGEITAQLPEGTELTDYDFLIINGGSLNKNDCSAISERLTHITSINFSNTSFKDNAIPFNAGDGAGTGTFSDLKSLQTVIFPDNLQTISNYVFSKCVALRNIEFGANSDLETIGIHAFSETTNLQNPTFPQNLSLIQEYAFYQCTSINHLTFPQGLTEIENYAFQNCTGLADVDAPWATPITVGAHSFEGAGPTWNDQKEIILHVPTGTADLYRATNWDELTIEDDFSTGVESQIPDRNDISYNYLSKLVVIRSASNDTARVINIKGQTVIYTILTEVDTTLDLNHLENGLYFVSVGEKVYKILK